MIKIFIGAILALLDFTVTKLYYEIRNPAGLHWLFFTLSWF